MDKIWLIPVALVIYCTVIGVGSWAEDNRVQKEHCQAYCQCQGNCSYTFDYDEVKGCDCK